tara:strand:- start:558 stop:866 length:309 start_codon:yes stop_codon:yes gene_type:complete
MNVIVNTIWTVKPDKKSVFIADLSTRLPATRAYDGCDWIYLVDSQDSNPSIVEAVSKWESNEKYQAYVSFRVDSRASGTGKENFQTAPPTMKIMPVIMDFNE